ncbi:hypothetical protein [uncultured Winogradskyella sp.]|uniref:hypothetical protein n=1 Tax=uncultured Winogradskyella sp. TaxID=395353 RepID=UPI0026262B55|nr:hypothetical protein [uncultured Winogradskyella sp.]
MKLNKLIVFLVFSLIFSCKNYYNDTINWADNLQEGISLESAKNRQPYYIEVDWENPQTIEDQKWYLIIKIKGNNDPLRMSHYLVFSKDKYLYRESKK